MDNLPDESTNGSINVAGIAFSSLARINNDLTSPQDAFAIKRCFMNCLFVPCSFPSAILADMEIEARSIWFLSEKHRVFSKRMNTSLARLIACCQIIKSSNLVESGMAVSLAQVNDSISYRLNPLNLMFRLNLLNLLLQLHQLNLLHRLLPDKV